MLDRPNPAARRRRRTGARPDVLVVHRALSDRDAPRHDVGELAKMFNERFGIGCDLQVVPMRDCNARRSGPRRALRGCKRSPNIPEWQTTFVYLRHRPDRRGRHQQRHRLYQAVLLRRRYKLDGRKLADALNARNLPGVWFRAGVVVADRRLLGRKDARRRRAGRDRPADVPRRALGRRAPRDDEADRAGRRDGACGQTRPRLGDRLAAPRARGRARRRRDSRGLGSSVREFENSRTRYLIYD